MGSPRVWVDDGVYYKIEHEKDRLKMGNGSWTIPVSIFTMDNVKAYCYQTEKGQYTVSKRMAVTKGFERVFQGENKLVVPLKNWHFIPKEVVNGKVQEVC